MQGGYLFPEIGRRRTAFVEANPDKADKIISLGIGDTTKPIPEYRGRRAIRRRTMPEIGATPRVLETNRGDAVAGTWIVRGDESRRRRDVDIPRFQVAATPLPGCG